VGLCSAPKWNETYIFSFFFNFSFFLIVRLSQLRCLQCPDSVYSSLTAPYSTVLWVLLIYETYFVTRTERPWIRLGRCSLRLYSTVPEIRTVRLLRKKIKLSVFFIQVSKIVHSSRIVVVSYLLHYCFSYEVLLYQVRFRTLFFSIRVVCRWSCSGSMCAKASVLCQSQRYCFLCKFALHKQYL